MTVVEMNTLILMLKDRQQAMVINKVLNMLFLITWVATRLIWFPLMSVYVASMPGYPNLAGVSCVLLQCSGWPPFRSSGPTTSLCLRRGRFQCDAPHRVRALRAPYVQ